MNSKQIEANAFAERIRKLNENASDRCVWDSIDRPMRPLVFELARIGMIPKFSCCGFYYADEEEPKTHLSHGPYVHFWRTKGEACKTNFDLLKEFAIAPMYKLYHWQNGIFNLCVLNTVPDDMYMKEDNISESIHQHEAYVIGIYLLTMKIQDNIPTLNDPVVICDGNGYYKEISEWHVKPKNDFVISVSEYYEKYGKATGLHGRPAEAYYPNQESFEAIVI